jgi:ubiquinone/menaquinone biosynthesis C-methylase UbiE
VPADQPSVTSVSADYDAVAELYDRAFADITVRRDEWRWMSRQLRSIASQTPRLRVLDIGCGNGALLKALAASIEHGTGIDVSTRSIAIAQHNARDLPQLTFRAIDSATLPFDDASFDVVISFLSFRYLEWDTIAAEIVRVLRARGSFLLVDMARQPIAVGDVPLLLRSGLQHVLRPLRDRAFHRDVQALTRHPGWHAMLARHPMRHASEYRACLQRHFPAGTLTTVNTTLSKRVIAFHSRRSPSA